MRRALATACILLLPLVASAGSYSATLTGDTGSGLAVIGIDDTTITYSILVSGFAGPDAAVITDGTTTVDLMPSFVAGSANGSMTSADAAAIAAAPTTFQVQVTGTAGTLAGALTAGAASATTIYHPVVANIGGLGDTNFVTDVRMVNRSGGMATVTVDYYAEGAAGNTEPTATATVMINNNEQKVVNDFVQTVYGLTDSKGAVIVRSDRPISSALRIYNDQTAAGLGTFGQFSQGLPLSHGWSAGVLPFLSNEAAGSGAGYRANIGWFNPNATAIAVTFRGYDATGTLLGEISADAPGYQQLQVNVADLWPALADYGDFYVTYEVDGDMPVFMYASVVDNVNGDAIYIPAVPAS